MTKKKKIRLFRQVISKLEKKYPNALQGQRTDPLEQLLSSIVHFDAPAEKVGRALEVFRDEFVDWNEVRVSAVSEIAGALRQAGIEEDRARLIKSALSKLFLKKNQLTLDFIKNYNQKQASDFLSRFEGLHPSIIDEVMLLSLGFPCFPMNDRAHRVCVRLGLVEDGNEASARKFMEAIIPKFLKSKAYTLIATHAEDTCKAKSPACPTCILQSDCQYYELKQTAPKDSRTRSKSSRKVMAR